MKMFLSLLLLVGLHALPNYSSEYFDSFHTYPEIEAYFKSISHKNSKNPIAYETIGESTMGNSIFSVTISPIVKKPLKNEIESQPPLKLVYIQGLSNYNHWISTASLQLLVSEIHNNKIDNEMKKVLKNTRIVIVPAVNPDKYNISQPKYQYNGFVNWQDKNSKEANIVRKYLDNISHNKNAKSKKEIDVCIDLQSTESFIYKNRNIIDDDNKYQVKINNLADKIKQKTRTDYIVLQESRKQSLNQTITGTFIEFGAKIPLVLDTQCYEDIEQAPNSYYMTQSAKMIRNSYEILKLAIIELSK
jgi:hypothetical protein